MSDYITLTELKNTLELTNFSFADYDGMQAISAASRGVDEFTGRRFWVYSGATAGVTRYYSPFNGWQVAIDDLVSAGTVATDYDGDGVHETTWTANTDYVLEPLNAAADGKPYDQLCVHPRSTFRFPCWPRSVAITGQWGWTAAPSQVKEATSILAARLLKRKREAPFGVVAIGVDNQPIRISSSDPDVAFLLNPFVKGSGVLAA